MISPPISLSFTSFIRDILPQQSNRTQANEGDLINNFALCPLKTMTTMKPYNRYRYLLIVDNRMKPQISCRHQHFCWQICPGISSGHGGCSKREALQGAPLIRAVARPPHRYEHMIPTLPGKKNRSGR